MMPLAWPSMRSIARWVLPVFVGPRTAVNERLSVLVLIFLPVGAVSGRIRSAGRRELHAAMTALLSSGTIPERIPSESLTRADSTFVPYDMLWFSPAEAGWKVAIGPWNLVDRRIGTVTLTVETDFVTVRASGPMLFLTPRVNTTKET